MSETPWRLLSPLRIEFRMFEMADGTGPLCIAQMRSPLTVLPKRTKWCLSAKKISLQIFPFVRSGMPLAARKTITAADFSASPLCNLQVIDSRSPLPWQAQRVGCCEGVRESVRRRTRHGSACPTVPDELRESSLVGLRCLRSQTSLEDTTPGLSRTSPNRIRLRQPPKPYAARSP